MKAKPTSTQLKALAELYSDNGLPQRAKTSAHLVGVLAKETPVNMAAVADLPQGQQQFYQALKALQADQTGRQPSEIGESRVRGTGIVVTDPLTGAQTKGDHDLFFQRWDPPAGVATRETLIVSPAYQATGRWWSSIADGASRQGSVALVMDHGFAGFSKGEAGKFDGATLAAETVLMLQEAARLDPNRPVKVAGESLGAAAALCGVVLAYNGKTNVPAESLPKGPITIALANPYLGKFSTPGASLLGKVLGGLPGSIPAREFLTNVVRDEETEKKFDAMTKLEDVQIHPSALASAEQMIQNTIAGLERGELTLPPNIKVDMLLSEQDASVDRGETARLIYALGSAMRTRRLIPGEDHAIVLNKAAQPHLVELCAPSADKPKAPSEDLEYDYVFIGAGVTGGTAAAELAGLLAQAEELKQQGYKVLVLEGGKEASVPVAAIPAAHAVASEHKDLLADPNRDGVGEGYRVRHFSDDVQAHKDPKADANGTLFKPRLAGPGGSAQGNANVFMRVDDSDWDALASATGDPAFRAENMKPLLQELTHTKYRPVLEFLHRIGKTIGFSALQNLGGHGFDGPIEITRADPRLLTEDLQLAEIALRSTWWSLRHLGSPIEKLKRLASMFDPNDDAAQLTEGPVLMPMSVNSRGKRNGARDLILAARDRDPEHLSLHGGARVERLVLDEDNRCQAVVYKDQEGRARQIKVKREAIVAAGAMESAALLMRSGIGPKADLEKLGIESKVDLRGVGKYQGFRYEVGVVVRLKQPFEALKKVKVPPQPDDPLFRKWMEGGGGLLGLNGVVMSFAMRSSPELAEPDLVILALPGEFTGYEVDYSKKISNDPNKISFLVLSKNKGQSYGTLALDPNDPTGAPKINHHFFDERRGDDVRPGVVGVKTVREMIKDVLGDMVESEVWPGPDAQTDEQIAERFKSGAWDHHPRGGAQMGHVNDPDSVVDSDFRVIGTKGVRVICASVLPNNIGAFIASGLYQVGKLAGQKIAADAALDKPKAAQTYNPLSIRTAEKAKDLGTAQQVTASAAGAAHDAGLITDRQKSALVDGTVSAVDVELAWSAIEAAIAAADGEKGGDNHTLAHNLLIAVEQQVGLQEPKQTKREGRKDRFNRFIGRR